MQIMAAPNNRFMNKTKRKSVFTFPAFRSIVAWGLGVLTSIFLISGFGITEPGLVGLLTFGMLGKTLSYRIHTLLWGPFLIVLVLHLALSCRPFSSQK